MSIPADSRYIGRDANATVRLLHLAPRRTKSTGSKNHPHSYHHEEVCRSYKRSLCAWIKAQFARANVQISSSCNVLTVSLTARNY
jgi:hypothetical protein